MGYSAVSESANYPFEKLLIVSVVSNVNFLSGLKFQCKVLLYYNNFKHWNTEDCKRREYDAEIVDPWLLDYLLTYLLHGAESFLGS